MKSLNGARRVMLIHAHYTIKRTISRWAVGARRRVRVVKMHEIIKRRAVCDANSCALYYYLILLGEGGGRGARWFHIMIL